jgi:hypothetical protein
MKIQKPFIREIPTQNIFNGNLAIMIMSLGLEKGFSIEAFIQFEMCFFWISSFIFFIPKISCKFSSNNPPTKLSCKPNKIIETHKN